MTTYTHSSSSSDLFSDLSKRLVSFDTIMREPLPPIEWLVESILPMGTRTVVFGEFGSMKSWALLDLALHLAAGRPWLDTFAVSQPRSVLFIDEEMPERELRRRVKRIGTGMGLEEQGIPFRAISHLGKRFQEGVIEALLDDLIRTDFDPDIIMVETFRRVLVGSENEAAHVADFWHSVSPILTAGKTLIVSHHMRKPNAQGVNDSRYRASGSTDILAGADCAYAITRKYNDLTISCVKNRVAVEYKPFHVVMEDSGSEDAPVILRYVGGQSDTVDEPSKIERAMNLILAFLKVQPEFTATTEGILWCLEDEGISERTGERALRALYDRGTVQKTQPGLYRITPGLKAI